MLTKNLSDVAAMAPGRGLSGALGPPTPGRRQPWCACGFADPPTGNAAPTLGPTPPARSCDGCLALGSEDRVQPTRASGLVSGQLPRTGTQKCRVYLGVQICTEISCSGGITRAFV